MLRKITMIRSCGLWKASGLFPPLCVFGEQVCRSSYVQGVILLWQAGIESTEKKDRDCFDRRAGFWHWGLFHMNGTFFLQPVLPCVSTRYPLTNSAVQLSCKL